MSTTSRLAERIRERAHPLRDASDLDPLLERVGNARCVLLGEASHGTSEYYSWRARISEHLLRELIERLNEKEKLVGPPSPGDLRGGQMSEEELAAEIEKQRVLNAARRGGLSF